MPVTLQDLEAELAARAPQGLQGMPQPPPETLYSPPMEPQALPPQQGISLSDLDAELARREATPPSTLEKVARYPVLAIQGVGKGLLATTGLPADLANLYLTGMHAGLKAIGVNAPEPAKVPGGSAEIEKFYTQTLPETLGIPRPIAAQTGPERIIEQTGRTMGGVAALAPAAPIATMATAGAVPGLVGAVTQEVTESPIAGAVAQVGTAIGPSALLKTAQTILRRGAAAKQLTRAELEAAARTEQGAAQEAVRTEAQTTQQALEAQLRTARGQSAAAELEQARVTQARKTAVQRTFAEQIEQPYQAEKAALTAAQKGVSATTPEQIDELARTFLTTGKDVSREAVREAYKAIDTSAVQGLSRAPLDEAVAAIPLPVRRGLREALSSIPAPAGAIEPQAGAVGIPSMEQQQFLRTYGGIGGMRLAGKELKSGMEELLSFFGEKPAGPASIAMPNILSYQQVRDVQTVAGQAMRILEDQVAKRTDVAAPGRLAAMKQVYAATAKMLDNSITPAMPAAVQAQLLEANTLNRIQSSMESLAAHAKYRATRLVGGEEVFDADKMLMAIKGDTYLQQSLEKFGALKGLETTLADMAGTQKRKLMALDKRPLRELNQQITQEAAEASRLRQEALAKVSTDVTEGKIASANALAARRQQIDADFSSTMQQIVDKYPKGNLSNIRRLLSPFGAFALTKYATGSSALGGVAAGATALEESLSYYFLSEKGQQSLKTLLGRDPTLSATTKAAVAQGVQQGAQPVLALPGQ